MRVTILTPTLNAERFLPECLSSIAGQTYPRDCVQHVVVDGESIDATARLAREAGAEVHVARDDSLYEAMNRGIERARGDVVGWLNADDFMEPGALASVVAAFERAPDAEIVVGDYRLLLPGERVTVVRGRADALARIRAGKRRGGWVTPLAVYFRTATLRDLGGYAAAYRVAADLDLWLRAAARDPLPRVVHAGAILGTFRFHRESLSSGRGVDRSLEETAEIGARWAGDPAAPRGVRRYGLFVQRRHDYLRRARAAGPRGILGRLAVASAAYRDLRRLGPGAIGDMRTSMVPW